tara:strand:+ start:115 stop:1233 length:1119 start_codon:yes stop_codon:yes gene_type:complete
MLYDLLICFITFFKDFWYYNINLSLYLRERWFSWNLRKVDTLFHAASCGEAKLLIPILDHYKKENIPYLLSVHTPTGYKLMQKYNDLVVLKPMDTFPTMAWFFFWTRPKKIIISVSDTWFYFLIFAKLFQCKILYINYIIKPQKPLRNQLHYLIADKIYLKQKQISESISKDKYEYLGDIRYCMTNNKREHTYEKENILTIGSANENEIDIHLKLIKIIIENTDYKVIYVPRHLNWKTELERKLKDAQIFQKTAWFTEKIYPTHKINVYWCYGVLEELYSYSKSTLIGDTFNNIGGHNIIEPALRGNNVIVGPHHKALKETIQELKYIKILNKYEDILKYLEEDEKLYIETNKIKTQTHHAILRFLENLKTF